MSHRHVKQEESAKSARNEAQRRAHELKHDALLDQQTHFDKRCAMEVITCDPCCSTRVLRPLIINMLMMLCVKYARPRGPARTASPALLSRYGRAREAREERAEITLSQLI